MRKQDIAIILATLALVLVTCLALLGQMPKGDPAAPAHREEVRRAEPPLRAADTRESGARLGGGTEALAAQVERLQVGMARLEAELEKVKVENARLAAQVDPVADLLALLERERPKLERAREQANRTAAIAAVRNFTSAQAQIQASARIDVDQDGTGEFGGFREMSGAVPGRMDRLLVPPVLSSAFKELNDYGEAERAGYLFRYYLPGPRGSGIGEPRDGFDRSSGVDPDLAETTWCVYAWPVAAGESRRVYFMNQAGDVLATEADYVGPGGGPAPDAAFVRAGSITGRTAIGTQGSDGNVWTQVN